MSRYLFLPILLLFLSLPGYPQDDAEQTDADKQADSILNEYFKKGDANALTNEGIDSTKLEQAESKYMDNFLRMERDEKKELLQKRILQFTIGLAFLAVLFISFGRKRMVRRDDRPPGM